jgi:nicotinamidase-related amidase
MKAILIIDIQNGLTERKGLQNELNFIETVNSAYGRHFITTIFTN